MIAGVLLLLPYKGERKMKIKAFHIDMNNAQFTGEFLKEYLSKLAQLGYNTIIWEVEDNIRWDTCPESSQVEAFSKSEFREILDLCVSLGLESVPLLQTIGHCEYVLKHEAYRHFAEIPGRVDQYCPLNEKVALFLNKWIDEYLELFGDVRFFHLGADEAWHLGSCDKCKAYAEQYSLSQLYFQHMNKFTKPLLDKGIRPIIWADMALRHPETIDLIDKRIVMCDWMYDIFKGCGTLWNWSLRHMQKPGELDEDFKRQFGKYIFPAGEGKADDYNIFYTSDYLADLGFDVIGCPASSACGDTVFLPMISFHLRNCFDFMRKGYEDQMAGWALTSWTCHLFPWILQEACIELPAWLERNPEKSLDSYREHYVKQAFDTDQAEAFWKAADCFAVSSGMFMKNGQLDIGKNPRALENGRLDKQIDDVEKAGKLDEELDETEKLVSQFTLGLKQLEEFAQNAKAGGDVLQWWLLGAKNLQNRAKVIQYLLQSRQGITSNDGKKLLEQMLELKNQTQNLYIPIIKTRRLQQMMHWIYDATETSLRKTLGNL